MLVAFSVENYRSFKDLGTLSMVAGELTSQPKELDTSNVFQARDQLKLLKSAAIYGANASGKSNLVAAIDFMRSLVLNSSRETRLRQPVAVTPYRLSTATEHAPTRCEIVFIQQATIYRYGFLVSRQRVEAEWLYATVHKKEAYLFERTSDAIKINQRMFKEGQGLPERTRPNALFLSVVAQWNGPRASQLVEWFEQVTINTGIETSRQPAPWMRYEGDQVPAEVSDFVRMLDLGIDDMHLERMPERDYRTLDTDGNTEARTIPGRARVRTSHAKYNQEGDVVGAELFDLSMHESQGTRRMVALAEPILAALQTGTVLIIDEIDARLHPILTCEIIRLFQSAEANQHHAQLIFTTHDTNLLGSDLFRRDQIWFVEKSRRGESTLYSLVEYKVRNNAAYEKNYVAGRYGAIPYLGSLSAVIGVDHGQTRREAEIEDATAATDNSDLPATFD